MRELLQTSHGIGVAVFRLKHNGSLQRIDNATLSGNAKLGGKIGVDVSDGFHIGKGRVFWNDTCTYINFCYICTLYYSKTMKTMKRVFMLLLLFAGVYQLQAQAPYCCVTKGAVLTYTDYNAKGKETGTTTTVYKDVNMISNLDYDVVMETTVDADGNQTTMETTMTVRNGNATISMGSGSIDLTATDPELLQIPNKLAVGYKLPLGEMIVDLSGFRVKSTVTENEVIDREEITTPAGTFKCYVVQQTSEGRVMGIKSTSTIKTWYSRGVGAVKTETYSNGDLFSSSVLTSMK